MKLTQLAKIPIVGPLIAKKCDCSPPKVEEASLIRPNGRDHAPVKDLCLKPSTKVAARVEREGYAVGRDI
jgi:hypothetical protein